MPLAFHYVSIVEFLFYLLLGTFFSAFSSQLNLGRISSSKAITIIVIAIILVYIKNWMRYNGKRRLVLNAKYKKKTIQAWKMVVVPIILVVLIAVFYQAI
ncbi:hypothetical protein [Winogradskyella sp.]|uniref:hypothetical protein n=1 Tax=Winogradskyella sp. TaxID=1883156 RepID=UPI0025EAEF4A|nr:hypothetical protein [Winogradskyella sp.]